MFCWRLSTTYGNKRLLKWAGGPIQTPFDNMETLLEAKGLSIDFPRQGETRQGIIASIAPEQILVNVGTKSEGVITGRELESIPKEERDAFQVDQEIAVYIVNPEDSNGNLVLSYMRAKEEESWQKAEELLASKKPFESRISGYNKGGLIVDLGSLRGFVPASQVSLSRRADVSGDTPEQRWGKMVDDPVKVCVIEVDRERRRLILSERAASSETRETLKERVIESLTEGDIRTAALPAWRISERLSTSMAQMVWPIFLKFHGITLNIRAKRLKLVRM